MTAVNSPGLIELQLESLDQLFDPFDPFPIPTRDLSRTAEEFVVGWARELHPEAPLTIRIYIPRSAVAGADVEGLQSAISGHFSYRSKRTRSDMRELIGIAQLSLVVGLCLLGVCIGIRQTLREAAMHNALAGFFSEGAAIVGWVANWRPIEILLFEWWPLSRRRRLFDRLAMAPVDVRARAGLAPDTQHGAGPRMARGGPGEPEPSPPPEPHGQPAG